MPSKRVLGLLGSETPGWVVTSVPSVSLNSYLWPTLCRHLWSLALWDLLVCQVRAPGGPRRAGVVRSFTGVGMLQDLAPPAHPALRPHEFPGDLTLGGSGHRDHLLAAHSLDRAPEGACSSHTFSNGHWGLCPSRAPGAFWTKGGQRRSGPTRTTR